MVNAYKAKLEEEEFFRLQNKMARRARTKGIFTEKEGERIVFADRGPSHSQVSLAQGREAKEASSLALL